MADTFAIRKNAREVIRVERQSYRGHALVNVRVWYDDGTGEYRPGKQGIAFKAELLDDVLAALGQLSDQREVA